MAITLAIQGTQLNAVYSKFANVANLVGPTPPSLVASGAAGIFGGSYISMNSASLKGVMYPGYANLPTASVFSVLLRIIPRYSGTPATNQVLWSMNSIGSLGPHQIELTHNSGTGFFGVRMAANGGSAIAFSSGVAFVPVSGTPVDIMVAWDGTTLTGGLKFGVDGVQLAAVNMTAPFVGMASGSNRAVFSIGQGISTIISAFDLNECVVYDTAENHVYSVRTGFVSVSAAEGFPPVGSVRSGLGSYYFVTPSTGTMVANLAADVKHGVASDGGTGTYQGDDVNDLLSAGNLKTGVSVVNRNVTVNGTYDGSDRWTAPSAGNLRAGIQLKNNSTSLNLTGTMVANVAADVKHGVASDGGTGTYRGADLYDVVAAAELKHGLTKNQDGSSVLGTYRAADLYDDVAATDLKHDVVKNQNGVSTTGTYRGADLNDVVGATDLKHGVVKNQNGVSTTGTYRAADLYDDVAAADLKHGVVKNQNGVSTTGTYRGLDLFDILSAGSIAHDLTALVNGANVVGTYRGADLYDDVAATDLKHGVTKNQNGISILGTYRGYDLFDLITAGNVKHGASGNVDGSIVVGTYRGEDLWVAIDPGIIKKDEVTTQDGATVIGTYEPAATACDYPAAGDTRAGVVFDNGLRTGTLNLAGAADIRAGVTQDNGAIVGALDVTPSEIEVAVDESDDVEIETEEFETIEVSITEGSYRKW
jgi:hypothetical protein